MARSSLIADRLRKARIQAGIARETAALHIGRSWSTVRAYENGSVMPPLQTVAALARLYGVTTDSLIEPSTEFTKSVWASRAAQGLPLVIEDEPTLRALAQLLQGRPVGDAA
jgi:DNA-binding XRE family transcriptional regulator